MRVTRLRTTTTCSLSSLLEQRGGWQDKGVKVSAPALALLLLRQGDAEDDTFLIASTNFSPPSLSFSLPGPEENAGSCISTSFLTSSNKSPLPFGRTNNKSGTGCPAFTLMKTFEVLG